MDTVQMVESVLVDLQYQDLIRPVLAGEVVKVNLLIVGMDSPQIIA